MVKLLSILRSLGEEEQQRIPPKHWNGLCDTLGGNSVQFSTWTSAPVTPVWAKGNPHTAPGPGTISQTLQSTGPKHAALQGVRKREHKPCPALPTQWGHILLQGWGCGVRCQARCPGGCVPCSRKRQCSTEWGGGTAAQGGMESAALFQNCGDVAQRDVG